MSLRGIVLLAYFIGSLPFCFFIPFYGILLWTIVSFLNPQSFIWGSAAFFPWAQAVAVPTLAGMLFFTSGFLKRLASREVFLIVLLWVWFTATTVISTSSPPFIHHAAETWNRWQFVSKELLMTIAAVMIVDSFARLRVLVLTIAACFGFFVVKAALFIVLSGGSSRVYGPEQSMISDNNDFGLALNMTLSMFYFLSQTEASTLIRRVCGGLAILTVPSVFFTYSRGAFLGLGAVLGLMFFRVRQRALLVVVIVIAAAAGLLFTPETWKRRMDVTSSGFIDASARSRFNSWTFSWGLALDYPFTGGGFETFTDRLFDIYAPNTRDVHGPHSIYFGVLAEHGFPGLVLYLSLVASCFATLFKIARYARRLGDIRALNYAHMFAFSIVGFLVSGTFLGRAYFDYYFTVVASIAVLHSLCRRAWAEGTMLDGEPMEEPEPLLADAVGTEA